MDLLLDMELIERSLKRCLLKEGFFDQFFFELCNIHPTNYCHLSGPDFEQYKSNLQIILRSLIEFGKGDNIAITAQKNLEIGLNEDTVSYWEQALIITIAANDEKLDQETSSAWRCLIQTALKYLLSQKAA